MILCHCFLNITQSKENFWTIVPPTRTTHKQNASISGNFSKMYMKHSMLNNPQPWKYLVEYILCKLLLSISTKLQKAHQHSRDIHIRFPYSKPSSYEINGSSSDGAVRRKLGAGRLQQKICQGLACHIRNIGKAESEGKKERSSMDCYDLQ